MCAAVEKCVPMFKPKNHTNGWIFRTQIFTQITAEHLSMKEMMRVQTIYENFARISLVTESEKQTSASLPSLCSTFYYVQQTATLQLIPSNQIIYIVIYYRTLSL